MSISRDVRRGGASPTATTTGQDEASCRPAFELVYAETVRFVRRAAGKLGVVSSAVDDVVQDVYVIVHRRLDRFAGSSSLQTWVYGIVRRVVRNHHRALRRKGAGYATSSHVDDPELLLDDAEGPVELVSRIEAERILWKLIEALGRPKATVFVLAEIHGLSAPEIAAITATKLPTVYSRRAAARKKLERALSRLEARPSLERARALTIGRSCRQLLELPGATSRQRGVSPTLAKMVSSCDHSCIH